MEYEWGLGKERTPVGDWLIEHGYTQKDLARVAGISRNTASKLATDPDYIPSPIVMRKVMVAFREVDPNVEASRFWRI